MGWHIHSFGAPCLRTYADALHRYNSIVPLRKSDTRPVGDRRKTYATIRLDSTTEAVIIRLYSTDVITYYADGVIKIEPYRTRTTATFLQEILPFDVWFQKGQLLCANRRFVISDTMHVKCVNGQFIFCGMTFPRKKVLNVERANKVKTALKPALQYIRARLKQETVSYELRCAMRATTPSWHGVDELRELLESPDRDDWDAAYDWLLCWRVYGYCNGVRVSDWAASEGGADEYKLPLTQVVSKLYKHCYELYNCYDKVEEQPPISGRGMR